MRGYYRTSGYLKTLVLFLSLAVAVPDACLAMGEREPDPACLASDTLRVKIGGEQFAFPRKMVRSVRGADVKHVKYDQPTASGSDACQKADDPTWNVDEIALDIKPENCEDNIDCYTRTIFSQIESLALYKQRMAQWSGLEKVYPNTLEELLAKCTKPKQPMNDSHSRTWSHCEYTFEDETLEVWIKFKGGVYPPADIEATKKKVLDEIRKHKITP